MQFLKRDCSFFFHLEDFFTKKKRLAAKEASFFSQELVETIPEINIYSTVKFSSGGKTHSTKTMLTLHLLHVRGVNCLLTVVSGGSGGSVGLSGFPFPLHIPCHRLIMF